MQAIQNNDATNSIINELNATEICILSITLLSAFVHYASYFTEEKQGNKFNQHDDYINLLSYCLIFSISGIYLLCQIACSPFIPVIMPILLVSNADKLHITMDGINKCNKYYTENIQPKNSFAAFITDSIYGIVPSVLSMASGLAMLYAGVSLRLYAEKG